MNRACHVGDDVVLRHGEPSGNDGRGSAAPRIGNRVDIGAGAVVIPDLAHGGVTLDGAAP